MAPLERHYASIIGKIFGIIWKAFCLMPILSKNLRGDSLRMNGSQVMAFLDQFSPLSTKIVSIICDRA